MKILLLSPNYAPELTGTGKYSGEMAEWLYAHGFEVDVLAARPHYPEWKLHEGYSKGGFLKETLNGVNVVRIPCYIPTQDKLNAKTRILMEVSFSIASFVHWIKLLLRKSKYDIVISVCPPMQPTLLALIYKWMRRVPVIFHVQDLQVDMAVKLGMIKSGLLKKVLYKVESWILKSVSAVSTITQSMKNEIVKKGILESKVILFPNWSDISKINIDKSSGKEFKKSLGISDDKFLFLYSGNLGEKQGLELIVNAAEKLQSETQAHFVIAGDGGSKESLMCQVKELNLANVTFIPLQSIELLNSLLNSADAHLIVQRSQTGDLVMPSKLTNILASGNAVVATADKDTELYNVIKFNELGFVCEPENIDMFIDALKSALEKKVYIQECGERARRFAEVNLNKDFILDEFKLRLQKVIKHHER